ncbi:MAG: hypothetical protein HZA54_04990, partial [Planctomycetes bacterium]|nr:hypothetical protein [Planctomycetota bacterium]
PRAPAVAAAPSPELADAAPAKGREPGAEPAARAPGRENFSPLAFWGAHLTTDDAGRAAFTVTFPDDLTTWRCTARALSVETQVGAGTSPVRTSRRVRAQLGAPTFLTERDAVSVAVSGHNISGATAAVGLDLSADGLTVAAAPAAAAVAADVPDGRALTAEWRLEAGLPGTATIEAAARADAEFDALRLSLPVHRHGVTQSAAFAWKIGDSPETFALELPAAADPKSAELTIALTPSLAAAASAARDYIADYPYGCTEQTLSRFVPDLAAAAVLRTLGVAHPALEKELPAMVERGLARLAALQHPDGGWGWWEKDATNPAMSAYVVRGLLLAQQLDAAVPPALLARALDYLKGLANGATLDLPTRALVLYDLAHAGVDCAAAVDATFGARERLSAGAQTRALLALALARLGKSADAATAAAELERAAREQDDAVYWGESAGTEWQTDAVESTAWSIAALAAVAPDSALLPRALDWLLLQRAGDRWKSTRDTANAVFALVAALRARPEEALEAEVAVTVNGTELVPAKVGRADLSAGGPAVRVAAHRLKPGANSVTLTRKSGPALHYNAVLTWVTPEENVAAAAAGFTVAREYFLVVPDPEGSAAGLRAAPLPAIVPRGAQVLVRLTVRTEAARDYVAIEDPLPATARVVTGEEEVRVVGWQARLAPDHREVREDRMAFFFDRLEPGTVTLAYVFEAAYPGRFHALPATAQLMYFPRVRGTSAEAILDVR